MANGIGQSVVPAVQSWEVRLASKAVSRLNGSLPAGAKAQVVEALLARIRQEQASRPSVEPTAEDAQKAVHRLLTEVLDEVTLRTELDAFFRANQGKAMAFAESILNNLAAAQDVVSQTYLELLLGKTTPKHFFRALKHNARDMQRQMARDIERFEPVEKVFDPRHLPGEDRMAGGESDEFSVEPGSSRLEDQDPLDQMIASEEQVEHEATVQAAFRHPKWRYCKRKKWARPLLALCAEMTPSRA